MDSRYDELEEAMLAAVGRFVAEIHAHDDSTGTHVESIGVVAGVIGRDMAACGLIDDWTAEWVERIAPLHDVGKLDVPSAVLNKRSSLDAEEWEVIRRHPTIGRQRITGVLSRMVAESSTQSITNALEQLGPLVDLVTGVVELHHETLDGQGYPHGLTDAEIPMGARIVAVADVYDALTAVRPYKEAWSASDAVGELSRMVDDGRLDPLCVESLRQSVDELDELAARTGR